MNLRALTRDVDRALDRALPPATSSPSRLHRAMRYSVFGGGKRLRPILALLACEAVSGRRALALPAACALEMIHTYSLIHDDLPAMDDDDFRRGRPSCHKAFDEATAILAGDALLTLAFETVAHGPRGATLVRELAVAAGHAGMVGGQQLDLAGSSRSNARALREIHERKTAALIAAAVRVGAIAAGAPPRALAGLGAFGRNLGLAFQIIDDILDRSGTAEALGKTPGKDQRQDKATYPALFGMEASQRMADRLAGGAIRAIAFLGARGEALRTVARFIVNRTT